MASGSELDEIVIAEVSPRLWAMGTVLFYTIPPGFFVWQASPALVRGHPPAVAAYLVIAAVVSIWGCFRGWRMALRFDGHGVMVRNPVRTYRIDWHEVRCFADGWLARLGDARPWALSVVLHDGHHVTASATAGSGVGRPATLTAIEQAAERYSVPAELTGRYIKRGFYADPDGQPGLRYWDEGIWSPLLPASAGGNEPAEKFPGKVLVPPQSDPVWRYAADRARRCRIRLAVFAAAIAAALAAGLVVNRGWFWFAGWFAFVIIGQAVDWLRFLKIYRASRSPSLAVFADASNSITSPRDDQSEDLAARVPIAHQPSPAADPAAGTLQLRCLECGAGSAEATQVCARCGAPITQQRSMAADPAAGQAGRSSSRRWPLILAAAGFVVSIAVVGVIAASTSSSSPLTWDQVRAGDCLQGSDLGLDTDNPWPDNVTKVPCAQQHIAEVFFAGDIWPQSLTYPGDNAVSNQADDHCVDAFAAYDGLASDSSEFAYKYFDPDNTTWPSGDRAVECIAYKPTDQYPGGAPVDYSIKGSLQ